MKKEGRGMAKATMQKVASKVVRGHEKRMHKMKSGGTVSSASKRADGIVKKRQDSWEGGVIMVAPLIGAGLRMGAKKLAQKFGKKDEKKTSINLIEEAQKKEAEGKRRAQIESVKEGVKTAAKTTAKATGAAGGAGVMYLTAEDRATSGQGGPALDALRKIGKKGEEEKEPVKKKAGGMIKSSASKRADGIAKKGKTRGKMV
jgi:hypothetical protein